MPKYLIERPLPGAGDLSDDEVRAIAQKSCGVLRELGPDIQWVQSYVTQNAITCVYVAPNERIVREHARRGGFPAEAVSEILRVIDPTTAEEGPARRADASVGRTVSAEERSPTMTS
jgi:hypothetical protein